MKLVVSAQDIAFVTVGLVDKGELKEQTIKTPPEGYLAALDKVLKDWSVAPQNLDAVIVVSGPGSFTASRVSTTMANGLGFAWNIPVIGIENPHHLLLKNLDLSAIEASMSYVMPTYDRSPESTVSKKMRGDNEGD